MERIIADRVAQAIEDHEKKQVPSSNSKGIILYWCCSHKDIYECQHISKGPFPHWWRLGTFVTVGSRESEQDFHGLNLRDEDYRVMTQDTEIQKMEQGIMNLTLKE
ncbi:hypothetical protein Tco_1329357 [Tanacetum coccineum]